MLSIIGICFSLYVYYSCIRSLYNDALVCYIVFHVCVSVCVRMCIIYMYIYVYVYNMYIYVIASKKLIVASRDTITSVDAAR